MNQKQRQREQDLRARVSNPAGGPWVGRAIADLEDQLAKQAQVIGEMSAELSQLQQDLGVGAPDPEKKAPATKKKAPAKPPAKPAAAAGIGPGDLLKD